MKTKIIKLSGFIMSLVLLQQGILLGNKQVGILANQSALVAEHDIDPSALFYTESALALSAEKQVRLATQHARSK